MQKNKKTDPLAGRLRSIVEKVATKRKDGSKRQKVYRPLAADLHRLVDEWMGPALIVDKDEMVVFANGLALTYLSARKNKLLGFPFRQNHLAPLKACKESVVWRGEPATLYVEEGNPMAGDLAELRRRLHQAEERTEEVESYFAQAKDRCQELETRFHGVAKNEEEARSRAQELARRVEQSEAALQEALTKRQVHDRLLDKMETAAERNLERAEEAEQKLTVSDKLRSHLEREVEQVTAELDRVRRRSEAELADVRRQLAETQKLVEAQAQKKAPAADSEELNRVKAKLTFAEGQAKEANSKLFDMRRELERAQAQLKASEGQLRGANQRIADLTNPGGGRSGGGGGDEDLRSLLRMKKDRRY